MRTGYGARAASVLRRAARDLRAGNARGAARDLARRVCSWSRSLLYVREAGAIEVDAPSALRIECIRAAEFGPRRQDLERAGALPDAELFDRGAACYLAWWQGQPAGCGWRYARSRLLERLGLAPGAVYAGNFHVREEARGRGIYPALLRQMCRDEAGAGVRMYVQTSRSNHASRRGLEKAGFRCIGELRVLVLAGCIVHCRIWTS